MSLKNKISRKNNYIAPDSQVLAYSWLIMADIVNGSEHDVNGGQVDGKGDPAKEYHYSFNLWDDEEDAEDDEWK